MLHHLISPYVAYSYCTCISLSSFPPSPFRQKDKTRERNASQTIKKLRLRQKNKKNNTRDSNVVPHRSTNRARRCLTSLSRREAVLSSWYGRSCDKIPFLAIQSLHNLDYTFGARLNHLFHTIAFQTYLSHLISMPIATLSLHSVIA
jgi:hypothetical protein